jgi:hypothetical protein
MRSCDFADSPEPPSPEQSPSNLFWVSSVLADSPGLIVSVRLKESVFAATHAFPVSVSFGATEGGNATLMLTMSSLHASNVHSVTSGHGESAPFALSNELKTGEIGIGVINSESSRRLSTGSLVGILTAILEVMILAGAATVIWRPGGGDSESDSETAQALALDESEMTFEGLGSDQEMTTEFVYENPASASSNGELFEVGFSAGLEEAAIG